MRRLEKHEIVKEGPLLTNASSEGPLIEVAFASSLNARSVRGKRQALFPRRNHSASRGPWHLRRLYSSQQLAILDSFPLKAAAYGQPRAYAHLASLAG